MSVNTKNISGVTYHTGAARPSRLDENMAGDIGVTGLVQKGLNAMGFAFKGTAREAYAILLTYFRDTTVNDSAAEPMGIIGVALNSLINRQKNRIDIERDGGYAQSVGDAAFWGAVDLAGTRGAMKGSGHLAKQQTKRQAQRQVGNRLRNKLVQQGVKKGTTTAMSKGLGTALKAIAGPAGWAMLGADVINDAINIVQACRNKKNPTLAPKKALDTLYKFFNHRGRVANTPKVQAALKTLSNLVAADAQKQNATLAQNKRANINQQNMQNSQNRINTQVGKTQTANIPVGQSRSSYYIDRQRNMNNRMVAESQSIGGHKVVRLTEADLHRIVAESVDETLNEIGVFGALGGAWLIRKFLKSELGRETIKVVRKEGIPALERLAKNFPILEKWLKNETVRKFIYGEAKNAEKEMSKKQWVNKAKGTTVDKPRRQSRSSRAYAAGVEDATKETAKNTTKNKAKNIGKGVAAGGGLYGAYKIGQNNGMNKQGNGYNGVGNQAAAETNNGYYDGYGNTTYGTNNGYMETPTSNSGYGGTTNGTLPMVSQNFKGFRDPYGGQNPFNTRNR